MTPLYAHAFPLVTVIVPARNEERHIGRCIEAIALQDYPLDRIEVIVVDGSSEDGTADVANAALAGTRFEAATVLDNQEGTTPSNLNLGLRAARGDIICRVDARSLIPRHHVSTCIDVLMKRRDVAVVGGAQVAIPPRDGAIAIGIARALNNRFVMGLSRYRRAKSSGPTDTVYLGAFRTADVRAVGGWNVAFTTNQDFELNRRMARTGLVWFEAGLKVGYIPRESLRALFHQYRRFGRWKATYWRTTGDRPRPRQYLLLAGPLVAGAISISLLKRIGTLRAATAMAIVVVALEAAGTTGPPAGLTARAAAVPAMCAVALGWWSGVLSGWTVRR